MGKDVSIRQERDFGKEMNKSHRHQEATQKALVECKVQKDFIYSYQIYRLHCWSPVLEMHH